MTEECLFTLERGVARGEGIGGREGEGERGKKGERGRGVGFQSRLVKT